MDNIDINELRKAAVAVFLATEEGPAQDLSDKLKWAADEIDKLQKIIASHPTEPGEGECLESRICEEYERGECNTETCDGFKPRK